MAKSEKDILLERESEKVRKADLAESLDGHEGFNWLKDVINTWAQETQNTVMNPMEDTKTDHLRGQFFAYKRVVDYVERCKKEGPNARRELERLESIE